MDSHIRFLNKKQKLKNKNSQLPKNQNSKSQPKFKKQKMKMTKNNVFVVLTFAALLSKLLQRKPKQEQLTISKTKILASKNIAHYTLHATAVKCAPCWELCCLLPANKKRRHKCPLFSLFYFFAT